jgi:hypothetical protein
MYIRINTIYLAITFSRKLKWTIFFYFSFLLSIFEELATHIDTRAFKFQDKCLLSAINTAFKKPWKRP